MCGFMFDGNFTAEQLKMKVPRDNVHLTDGDAFFTTSVATAKAAVFRKNRTTVGRKLAKFLKKN